ncbi:hypothetical protein [Enterococcus casseliflavus]|uniref:hypothetical protein n=1 Tax=Enterococcus casseliflavus TaxID=37734 RepID=UPI001883BE7D|nr:hypothetical protein [Enterococcus casseliflavus]MBE9909399.1 hypothetical protein [Enterococcus casseliflavus]
MAIFLDLLSIIGFISLLIILFQKNKFFDKLNTVQKISFIILSISISIPVLIEFFTGFAKGFWNSL